MLRRVPRTRQASPAPVQQRQGRPDTLRVRQAQARPCARPRASAVHAQKSDHFFGQGRSLCGGGTSQYFSVSNVLTLELWSQRTTEFTGEWKMKTRPGECLCSNACPGRGRRRRRPCSSVRDAPVSCACGKRKHGRARASVPQRSTLKEHVPRPGRSLFVGSDGSLPFCSFSRRRRISVL